MVGDALSAAPRVLRCALPAAWAAVPCVPRLARCGRRALGVFCVSQSAVVCLIWKVLDGSVITARRTAAVSAIATKVGVRLPRSERSLVALCGAARLVGKGFVSRGHS